MISMVPIALFGWVPAALAVFWFLPTRRAVLVAMLFAWMFLPIAEYPIPGWPDYTKMSATCGVVLLAIAVFDFHHVVSFRPAWIDLPLVLFCLFPFVSAIVNGLGIHEAGAVIVAQAITWGVPYLIGRIYFNDLKGLRELAIGIFAAGLLYVPFCWFEIWSGPILHKLVYGYDQPGIDFEVRFGILRPMVFMESALMLAVWMATVSVLGLWLLKSGTVRGGRGNWIGWMVPLPILTTILMRAVNGWMLVALGGTLLALSAVSRSRWWLIVVLALVPGFLAIRATGLWSGDQLVPIVALIHPSRGQSVQYRLNNENTGVANMHGHALFGHGRQAVALSDNHGAYITPDSLWIITLVFFGAAGLVSWIAGLLIPVFAFIRRVPAERWFDADVGPAAGLAVVLALSTIDHLANSMINPIFMLIAGGLVSVSSQLPRCEPLPGSRRLE
ncbi:MAG TPA: hypothetical protein VM165_21320 [Planctomycetaceae bacterium]|nr:hypothetical protein [Planctomycetaceae bacterium]